MKGVAVVGAGSWGTAVAALLGAKGIRVTMWARDEEAAARITAEHRNPRHLSDVVLPDAVVATSDVHAAVSGAEVVVVATPSHAVRDIAEAMRGAIGPQTPVVSLAKGIERGTLLRMTQVLAEVLGRPERLAALSGPNHAEEVSVGIPSATVVAAYDETVGLELRDLFSTPAFRVYTNPDVVGVEIAAATKNVIAVAAGMSDGLGYGDNTKATLMTRGLAEMARLGTRLGANPLTYMGLAGVGDLIATCTSRHSRNRALGEHVARGGTVESFAEQTRMVAEGALACVAVDELGRQAGVDMPITHQVRAILYEGASVRSAAGALMGREAKDELHGMGLVDDEEA
ncbi:MAG: NAD(P)H-dependent glycerol-3-phosphate dehydrogenase [Anaerosomatales bacterium]|nr:NAD(P)H-dependent glycerol-3-phosphate dehydrogenase [Anaerosomatales bacterium]